MEYPALTGNAAIVASVIAGVFALSFFLWFPPLARFLTKLNNDRKDPRNQMRRKYGEPDLIRERQMTYKSGFPVFAILLGNKEDYEPVRMEEWSYIKRDRKIVFQHFPISHQRKQDKITHIGIGRLKDYFHYTGPMMNIGNGDDENGDD